MLRPVLAGLSSPHRPEGLWCTWLPPRSWLLQGERVGQRSGSDAWTGGPAPRTGWAGGQQDHLWSADKTRGLAHLTPVSTPTEVSLAPQASLNERHCDDTGVLLTGPLKNMSILLFLAKGFSRLATRFFAKQVVEILRIKSFSFFAGFFFF